MKPNNTILFLLEQAKELYEIQTRELGYATQNRDKEQQKTHLLEGYLQEYRHRLQQGSEHGMRVSDLLNFQGFIAKLTDALEQQKRTLFLSERNLDRVQEQWREANRRMKSFEILLERRRSAAQIAETRREQREMDAYAARASLIRHSVY